MFCDLVWRPDSRSLTLAKGIPTDAGAGTLCYQGSPAARRIGMAVAALGIGGEASRLTLNACQAPPTHGVTSRSQSLLVSRSDPRAIHCLSLTEFDVLDRVVIMRRHRIPVGNERHCYSADYGDERNR